MSFGCTQRTPMHAHTYTHQTQVCHVLTSLHAASEIEGRCGSEIGVPLRLLATSRNNRSQQTNRTDMDETPFDSSHQRIIKAHHRATKTSRIATNDSEPFRTAIHTRTTRQTDSRRGTYPQEADTGRQRRRLRYRTRVGGQLQQLGRVLQISAVCKNEKQKKVRLTKGRACFVQDIGSRMIQSVIAYRCGTNADTPHTTGAHVTNL